MIEHAGGRVVGDVEVEAAIFIVVEPKHAEAVVLAGVDAEFLGDLSESAVAVVVVETIARAFESTRSAGDGNAAVLTEDTLSEPGEMIEIDIDIVGDV